MALVDSQENASFRHFGFSSSSTCTLVNATTLQYLHTGWIQEKTGAECYLWSQSLPAIGMKINWPCTPNGVDAQNPGNPISKVLNSYRKYVNKTPFFFTSFTKSIVCQKSCINPLFAASYYVTAVMVVIKESKERNWKTQEKSFLQLFFFLSGYLETTCLLSC